MKYPAMFFKKLSNDTVKCFLCSHNCVIKEGKYGICGQRKNIKGTLYTYAYGNVVAANSDPIEKKPLYHFLPGTRAFSIATPGCNFKCSFCQNWQISQADHTDYPDAEFTKPEQIVESAIRAECASIAYTYTEPTIFFEYSYDISILAKERGLSNIYVTNGYISKEALDKISPYLDAANIDLKSFSDKFYKDVCHARLDPVLDTIKRMKSLGIWVEVTTLLISGLNDSEEEIGRIADFIAEVSSEIPWHISRFHPDYRLQEIDHTPIESMEKAKQIGLAAGLKHVYLGNV
jgi:pyruvate formate lyase activating enzyme